MRGEGKAESGKRKAGAAEHSACLVRCLPSLAPRPSPLASLLSPLAPLLILSAVCVSAALAQRKEPLPPELSGVGITEQPGARIPLELPFVDSDGGKTRLGNFFDGTHPVILTLNYSDCPMLCSVQLNGLLEALRTMPWNLGQQFHVVTASIDPLETPERAGLTKEKYLKIYNRPRSAAGWHFLTGREENIKRLTAAVGFHYRYVPKTRQFVHPAALILCTPDGRVALPGRRALQSADPAAVAGRGLAGQNRLGVGPVFSLLFSLR